MHCILLVLVIPCSLLLGTVYPAYASYKAVKNKDVREYVKWMMYWIVFAAFTTLEMVGDIILAFWFPFYYELKIIFLLWLISPVSRGSLGSSILYRRVVHPNILKREQHIDRWIGKAQEQSYIVVVRLGRTALEHLTNFVMQTAIQAPTIMANLAANARNVDVTDGADVRRTIRLEHQTLHTSGSSGQVANNDVNMEMDNNDEDQQYLSFSQSDLDASTAEAMSPDMTSTSNTARLTAYSSDEEEDRHEQNEPRPSTSRNEDSTFTAPLPVAAKSKSSARNKSKRTATIDLSSDSEAAELTPGQTRKSTRRRAAAKASEVLAASAEDDDAMEVEEQPKARGGPRKGGRGRGKGGRKKAV